MALVCHRKYDRAEIEMKILLNDFKPNTQKFVWIGDLYREMREYVKAEKYYKDALKITSINTDYINVSKLLHV